MRNTVGLAAWLITCFLTAGIGAMASIHAGEFYGRLAQPDWAPPSWLFGPVWSVLYTLMGLSAWLVWRRHGFRGAQTALSLFIIHLVANGVWSWLFFTWHFGMLSVIDIIVLWSLVVVIMVQFWRLHRLAALMLIPYLLWVSFATALNYTLWQRNPLLFG